MGSLCYNEKGLCPNMSYYNGSCHINVGVSSYTVCLGILLGILTSQTNETVPNLMGHVSTRWGLYVTLCSLFKKG